MGNIVGKPFGVVASKDYNIALTESVKEGNQGKFYLTENGGKGFNDITATTDDSRNTLIVNGNKIQGVSTSDINNLNLISGSGLITDGAFKYKGSVDNISKLPDDAKVGDVYNISTHFMIGSINYPAYTSVVYVNDGTNTWQPLGGEMKLGTHIIGLSTIEDHIFYSAPDYEPIASFNINLDSQNGLYAKSDNSISIRLGPGLSTYGGRIVSCLGKGLKFGDKGSISINPGDGLIFSTSDELKLNIGSDLTINNNLIKLNANYLSGTVKDENKFYYSLGGIYFPDTIISGQQFEGMTIGPSFTTSGKKDYSLKLRCGTGLAFQEGWEDVKGLESSQILGHDGKYYVNIDNTTIGLNTDSKLRVKLGDSLGVGDDGINVRLPIPTTPELQYLPVSTAAILINDRGLCVDMPAFKRLVELVIATK